MRYLLAPLLSLALAVTAGVLLSLNGCGNDSPKIQHVVIIFQENRTPDNLFQDPVLKARGADIASSGVNSLGATIPLQQINLTSRFDLSHTHHAFELMYAGGKMTGADRVLVACPDGVEHCGPPNPQFTFIDPVQVQPYFQLAEQYTFGDRMFQTNQGPSFPAHQFIISGTSAPTASSPLFASENVSAGSISKPSVPSTAGCVAPSDAFVYLVDRAGNESLTQYPCFEHPTLIDLLEARRVSWRYYAPSGNSIWVGPDAIQHICQPETRNGELVCTGSIWSKVTIPQTRIFVDIAGSKLPQVSWVIPDGRSSDHAGMTNDGSGPSWVASVVNAIGNSPYWKNTAIIITWDDWGGWYDHVPPPIINSYEYGFRVPLIVVSPYAKRAYISHTQHDFGSILRFVEEQFGLPSLGYADAHADDLSDCFDYKQSPTTFQVISAPVPAEHFMNDRRPTTDPDDD